MKLARSFAVAFLLAFVTAFSGAADLATARPESVGMSSQRLQRLAEEMRTLSDSGQVSGVVTMVAKQGKVVAFDASGKRDVATGAPMQKDTIFRIYSMTKPITGVAMMILFEEGKWQQYTDCDDRTRNGVPHARKTDATGDEQTPTEAKAIREHHPGYDGEKRGDSG